MKKIKKVHAGTGRNPYLHRKIHPMHVIKSIVEMSVIVSRLLLLHLRSSYQAEFILSLNHPRELDSHEELLRIERVDWLSNWSRGFVNQSD